MNEIEQQHEHLVKRLAKPGCEINAGMSDDDAHIIHMALLIAGEVGELVDAIKKHVIYGKTLDRLNVIEELGDIEFALSAIRDWVMTGRDEVLATNIEKLERRYSSGAYSNQQAIERADKQ